MTSSTTAEPIAPTSGSIKIDQFITDSSKVTADLTVNNVDLNGDYIRQASLFYYYASMFARAEHQHSKIKVQLDAKEAMVADKIRKDAATAGEKVTEVSISEKVKMTPSIIRMKLALTEAKLVERELSMIVEAMKHKKDMLVIRGNTNRDEMKAKLAIAQEYEAPDRSKGNLAALRG